MSYAKSTKTDKPPLEIEFLENRLKWWLESPISVFFRAYKHNVHHAKSEEQHYIFLERPQSDVLVVAHMDTVVPPGKKLFVNDQHNRLNCSGLDDRLGCFLAVDVLPKMGIKADVLLCDHEEVGRSTAQFFYGAADADNTPYRYVIELDRAGEDVVTYDLDNAEFYDDLEEHFLDVGWGSFSDISVLPTDLCCVNVGIGYHRAHDKKSYCDLAELQAQLGRLLKFYNATKEKKYEQDPEFNKGYEFNFGYGQAYGQYSEWQRPRRYYSSYDPAVIDHDWEATKYDAYFEAIDGVEEYACPYCFRDIKERDFEDADEMTGDYKCPDCWAVLNMYDPACLGDMKRAAEPLDIGNK